MKRLFTAASALLVLLYPVAVYYGLQVAHPSLLALVLLVLLLGRWLLTRSDSRTGLLKYMNMVPAMAAFALLISVVTADSVGVKLYPIAMNAGMLAVFALSLLRPPSVIEMLARLSTPDLPESGIRYTRRVTQLWCVFFLLNGVISGWTAVAASLETWTLYNGFVAYLAMGTLLAGEWLFRTFILKPQ